MSDVITGAWRRPTNTSAHEKGGIHDDDTAQDLGFQGGTIAGSIHMEQFTPMLVEHFGNDWWQRGGMSLYFKSATVDSEPVRCLLEPLGDDRARIWMEDEAGTVIMEGSASLGADDGSELQNRVAGVRPPGDIRMLADVVIGQDSTDQRVTIPADKVDERLRVITEDLTCYRDGDIFGGRVLPVAPFVHAFRVVEPDIAPVKGPYVGMFGAIEVQYINGPVVAEQEYVARGRALAVSDSPKTEILWYAASLYDPVSGDEVARMIKMDRLLKGASPLWEAAG